MRGKEGSGVSEICLASRAQGSRHASCRAQGGQCDTSRGKASTRIQAPGQAAKKSLEMRPQGANLWYGQRDQSIPRDSSAVSARGVSCRQASEGVDRRAQRWQDEDDRRALLPLLCGFDGQKSDRPTLPPHYLSPPKRGVDQVSRRLGVLRM